MELFSPPARDTLGKGGEPPRQLQFDAKMVVHHVHVPLCALAKRSDCEIQPVIGPLVAQHYDPIFPEHLPGLSDALPEPRNRVLTAECV